MDHYPFLVEHKESGCIHVVEEREVLGTDMELTACGVRMIDANYRHCSLTIARAYKERRLCRRCTGSETVINFVIQHLKDHD